MASTTSRSAGPSSSSTKHRSKSIPSPVRTSKDPMAKSHLRTRARPEPDSAFVVRRQAEISLLIATGLVVLASLFPSHFSVSTSHTRTPTLHQHSIPAKFLFLSYEDPTTGRYLKGPDDAAVVAFWVLAFTFIRVALMRWVWAPLARVGGIRKRGTIERFGEQGWNVAYNSTSFICGSYIFVKSSYSLRDTTTLWRNYPYDALPSTTKLYYLIQTGFWIQQFLVLHTEKRRKDHYQMFAHHCFTATLLVGSYYCNTTPVGNAILMIMDPADVFLSLAKMLKYLGFSTLCDMTFVVFMAVWVITRHFFFNKLLYSCFVDTVRHTPMVWRPDEGLRLSRPMLDGFLISLTALQGLLCLWFTMIVKVAIRVLRGDEAADSRSDDEDDEEEEEETSPSSPAKKPSKPSTSSASSPKSTDLSQSHPAASPASSSDSSRFSGATTDTLDDSDLDELCEKQ